MYGDNRGLPGRSRTVSFGAGGCLGIMLLAIGLFFLQAWLVMLLWGVIGTTFWETGQWRTIGYGTAMLVTLALDVVGGFFKGSGK
jgi:hypothetical protein